MSDIFRISSDLVDQLTAQEPELSTFLGLPGRDHQWSDMSPAGYAARRSIWSEALAAAERCDTDGRKEDVAKAVLIAEAERELRTIDSEHHLADLNNIASPWQGLRDTFDSMPDHTVEAWENIIARLRTIGEPLDGYLQCLELGLQAGASVAARQVTTAIEQGRIAAGADSGFGVLVQRYDAARDDNPSLGNDLRAQLEAAIADAKSAVGSATDWLESEYLPNAADHDGVGRDRYVVAAERFLGQSIDTDELYAWGWSELDRLTHRLAELCAQIDPAATPTEVVERLHTDPAFGAARTISRRACARQ